jgi:hypothetical protein
MQFEIHDVDGFICDHQFENVLKNTRLSNNFVILLCTREINGDLVVAEDYIPKFKKKFRKFIEELKIPDRKIILFLNTWYLQYRDIFEIDLIDDVIFLDLFLYDTYKKLLIENQSPIVQKYTFSKKNQFLFLMNKSASKHRIGLLYKLFQKNLLKDSIYSFVIHNGFTEKESRRIMDFLSEDDFDLFYKNAKRFLDLEYDPNNVGQINYTHYTGIPYDYTLFRDCNFQLISETHFDMTVWITEKTWISMMNKRPFIIAAYPGFLKRLKEMGFKTYENYLLHSNYDSVVDDETRLNQIVENVNYWLQNISQYEDEIKKDTDHNFSLLLEYAKKNQKIINDFNQKYKITINVDGYLNYKDQIWYKGLK